jgi:hypothetical protein
MNRLVPGLLACAFGALFVPAFTPAFTQDACDAGADDMAAMMAKAQQYMQPGPHHKELERFLGKWTRETRITMVGYDAPAEKGTAEFSWLMPGRWLKGETKGTLMRCAAGSIWRAPERVRPARLLRQRIQRGESRESAEVAIGRPQDPHAVREA